MSETVSSSSSSSLRSKLKVEQQFPDYFPHASAESLVEISDASFYWKVAAKDEKVDPALYVMALDIKPASFTGVIGP